MEWGRASARKAYGILRLHGQQPESGWRCLDGSWYGSFPLDWSPRAVAAQSTGLKSDRIRFEQVADRGRSLLYPRRYCYFTDNSRRPYRIVGTSQIDFAPSSCSHRNDRITRRECLVRLGVLALPGS